MTTKRQNEDAPIPDEPEAKLAKIDDQELVEAIQEGETRPADASDPDQDPEQDGLDTNNNGEETEAGVEEKTSNGVAPHLVAPEVVIDEPSDDPPKDSPDEQTEGEEAADSAKCPEDAEDAVVQENGDTLDDLAPDTENTPAEAESPAADPEDNGCPDLPDEVVKKEAHFKVPRLPDHHEDAEGEAREQDDDEEEEEETEQILADTAENVARTADGESTPVAE